MNYYIADTHFGHENVIRLSNRPFNSLSEMEETIISNWNARVTDKDDVYILGDFTFRSKDPISYLKRLKGKKYLIVGNHDEKIIKDPELAKYFVEITHMKMISDNGTKVVLCHYPMVEWNGYYRDVLHFYGHVHNTFHNETTAYAAGMKNAYNVGVDVIGFMPRTLEEIVGMKEEI